MRFVFNGVGFAAAVAVTYPKHYFLRRRIIFICMYPFIWQRKQSLSEVTGPLWFFFWLFVRRYFNQHSCLAKHWSTFLFLKLKTFVFVNYMTLRFVNKCLLLAVLNRQCNRNRFVLVTRWAYFVLVSKHIDLNFLSQFWLADVFQTTLRLLHVSNCMEIGWHHSTLLSLRFVEVFKRAVHIVIENPLSTSSSWSILTLAFASRVTPLAGCRRNFAIWWFTRPFIKHILFPKQQLFIWANLCFLDGSCFPRHRYSSFLPHFFWNSHFSTVV